MNVLGPSRDSIMSAYEWAEEATKYCYESYRRKLTRHRLTAQHDHSSAWRPGETRALLCKDCFALLTIFTEGAASSDVALKSVPPLPRIPA